MRLDNIQLGHVQDGGSRRFRRASWFLQLAGASFPSLAPLPAQVTPAEELRVRAITYPELLQQCVDPDWLWRMPVAGESLRHWAQPLPQREAAGFLLADAQGPGILVRFWAAAPRGSLQFEIDGELVWALDLAELGTTELATVPVPLSSQAAGAGTLHLPIPFRSRLRVFGSDPELAYEASVRQVPAGTALPSFHPGLLTEHAALLAVTAERLLDTRPAAGPGEGEWSASKQCTEACLVRNLWLRVDAPLQAAERASALRQATLRVSAAGEVLVHAPVADFFGAGLAWRPWHSLRLGIDDEGIGYCRWPMPLPRGARIEVLVPATTGSRVSLAWQVEPLPEEVEPALRFHAHFREWDALGQPAEGASPASTDWLDLQGAGRLVGCTLRVRNPSRYSWAEGGVRCLPGETEDAVPAWLDFDAAFGRGARSVLPLQHPLHAIQPGQGPGHYGVHVLHRSRGLDAVPFPQRLQLAFWPQHASRGARFAAATVFYWYGAAGAHAAQPQLVASALLPLPAAPAEVDADRHEGEHLRVLGSSGGTHEVQDLSYRPQMFSGDKQLLWRNGKPGDQLELAVPVREAGDYRVSLALCMADDYGQVAFSLAGVALGEPFDGYSPRLAASGPRDLGVVSLPAGDAVLRCILRGKHDKAKPAYMVGIDYLRLERVR